MAKNCATVISSSSLSTILRARWTMDQNRNITVSPEHSPDI